jgi:hypothetical protein
MESKHWKDVLIRELKRLKPVVKSAPENYDAVCRAGELVTLLRDKWNVSDDEMKRILKRRRKALQTEA